MRYPNEVPCGVRIQEETNQHMQGYFVDTCTNARVADISSDVPSSTQETLPNQNADTQSSHTILREGDTQSCPVESTSTRISTAVPMKQAGSGSDPLPYQATQVRKGTYIRDVSFPY